MNGIKKLLLYLTNDEDRPRHEEAFDVVFWIVETAMLIFGTLILLKVNAPEWIAFLVIEYCWAWDNLRHNRP